MNANYQDDSKCPKSKPHGEYALYKQPADREEWNDTLNTLEKWKSKEQYRAE